MAENQDELSQQKQWIESLARAIDESLAEGMADPAAGLARMGQAAQSIAAEQARREALGEPGLGSQGPLKGMLGSLALAAQIQTMGLIKAAGQTPTQALPMLRALESLDEGPMERALGRARAAERLAASSSEWADQLGLSVKKEASERGAASEEQREQEKEMASGMAAGQMAVDAAIGWGHAMSLEADETDQEAIAREARERFEAIRSELADAAAYFATLDVQRGFGWRAAQSELMQESQAAQLHVMAAALIEEARAGGILSDDRLEGSLRALGGLMGVEAFEDWSSAQMSKPIEPELRERLERALDKVTSKWKAGPAVGAQGRMAPSVESVSAPPGAKNSAYQNGKVAGRWIKMAGVTIKAAGWAAGKACSGFIAGLAGSDWKKIAGQLKDTALSGALRAADKARWKAGSLAKASWEHAQRWERQAEEKAELLLEQMGDRAESVMERVDQSAEAWMAKAGEAALSLQEKLPEPSQAREAKKEEQKALILGAALGGAALTGLAVAPVAGPILAMVAAGAAGMGFKQSFERGAAWARETLAGMPERLESIAERLGARRAARQQTSEPSESVSSAPSAPGM